MKHRDPESSQLRIYEVFLGVEFKKKKKKYF